VVKFCVYKRKETLMKIWCGLCAFNF